MKSGPDKTTQAFRAINQLGRYPLEKRNGTRFKGFSAGMPAELTILEKDGSVVSSKTTRIKIFGTTTLPSGESVLCAEILEVRHDEAQKVEKGFPLATTVTTALPAQLVLGAGRPVIDFTKLELWADRKPVVLNDSEFDLLAEMAERSDAVVSRFELAELMGLAPDTLALYIPCLRKKIADQAPGAERVIETVRGKGYRILR